MKNTIKYYKLNIHIESITELPHCSRQLDSYIEEYHKVIPRRANR